MIQPAVDLLRQRLETNTGPEGDLYRALDQTMSEDPRAERWTVYGDYNALLTDDLKTFLTLLGYKYHAAASGPGVVVVTVSF